MPPRNTRLTAAPAACVLAVPRVRPSSTAALVPPVVVICVLAMFAFLAGCKKQTPQSPTAGSPATPSVAPSPPQSVAPPAPAATARQVEATAVARFLFPESELAPSHTVVVDQAKGEYRVCITRMVIPSIAGSRPDLTGVGPAELKERQTQLDAASKDWVLQLHLRVEGDAWLLLGTSVVDETGVTHTEMHDEPLRLPPNVGR